LIARTRSSYRNLCHYLNMSYIDFRSGRDLGDGHKHLDLDEWKRFLLQYIHVHDQPFYETVGRPSTTGIGRQKGQTKV
jgi:hypothetical protein